VLPCFVKFRSHLRRIARSCRREVRPVLRRSLCPPFSLPTYHSKLRTLFQVTYPVSPLLAILAKTAGVCTNNSHSGTLPSSNHPLSSSISYQCPVLQFSSFCAPSWNGVPLPRCFTDFRILLRRSDSECGSLLPLFLPTRSNLYFARLSKFFKCNTYGPPRKCCKQRTYGQTKPFRCNTYKNRGGRVPGYG